MSHPYEDLTGKVALITGGTKGIGGATARRLRAAGAKVVASYSSDSASADAFIQQLGGPDFALAVQADAGSVADNERLVKAAVEKFGKIDMLIPNAGLMQMATLLDTTEEIFDKSYNVNVKGPYFLIKAAIEHMPPGSSIVLISTSQCHHTTVTPPYLLYCSTKGAIEQMTRVLSKDLVAPPRNIRVNCVAPGPTATELFMKGKSEQVLNQIKSLNPQKRIAGPEEVADAIATLCGPSSRWISSQIVKVNGGSA